jgi:putative DNA primase/helicase
VDSIAALKRARDEATQKEGWALGKRDEASSILKVARATPSNRVRSIARSVCAIADCADALAYLSNRALWPLPEGCQLRAHAALEYWEGSRRIGSYPGLVAEIRDMAGELVTTHVTYLAGGQKVASHEPRKILSPLTGREGCAVRLLGATDVLGIAEGIETALSASIMENVAVWAALNTSLLAKFEPPAHITRLVIFADRDEAGLLAAGRLMERLQGRIPCELRVPPAPHKDFNDVLMSRRSGEVTP